MTWTTFRSKWMITTITKLDQSLWEASATSRCLRKTPIRRETPTFMGTKLWIPVLQMNLSQFSWSSLQSPHCYSDVAHACTQQSSNRISMCQQMISKQGWSLVSCHSIRDFIKSIRRSQTYMGLFGSSRLSLLSWLYQETLPGTWRRQMHQSSLTHSKLFQ